MNQERYIRAPTRVKKSAVLDDIFETIRALSANTGFVRQNQATERWYTISEQQAREKVGHAMRDAIREVDKQKKRTLRFKEATAKNAASRRVSDFSTLLDELGVVLDDNDNRMMSLLILELDLEPLCQPDTSPSNVLTNMGKIYV
jgi:hypothetical protein